MHSSVFHVAVQTFSIYGVQKLGLSSEIWTVFLGDVLPRSSFNDRYDAISWVISERSTPAENLIFSDHSTLRTFLGLFSNTLLRRFAGDAFFDD
jgi:hypothetical protein